MHFLLTLKSTYSDETGKKKTYFVNEFTFASVSGLEGSILSKKVNIVVP